MPDTRRIAIVGDAGHYVGPELARHLAARGHDLVLGDPDPGLVSELEAGGAQVEVVEQVRNLTRPESAPALVAAALARFGRVDSAVAFSGQIVTGRFVNSTIDDLRSVVSGCLEGPYHFLKAAVAPMIEQGDGQILLITSAA
ncbi:MAG: SDR family NAD(P)-dependent oxidoreductase, partial [Acidimicrobiales bacterium]